MKPVRMFRFLLLCCLLLLTDVTYLAGQTVQQELLGRWSRPDLVGSSLYNNTYNEVWGFIWKGIPYAVIGSTQGTHLIDLENPREPKPAFFIPGAARGTNIIHRDYKTYQHYLYAVCDEGLSSLQIIDFSGLPDTVQVVYDNSALLSRAHNIFIDTAEARMYALAYADGTRRFYPMAAFDISEPVAPKLLATYREFGGLKPSHIHDAYVRNHIAYLNAGYDGLVVADFTNPQAPQTLGLMQRYTGAGYNHSGWASADGQYYYMGDETHGSPVKTIQLNFDCQPEVMTTFNAESRAPSSIAHNQVVACGYLYVSYYYDGLQIFDLRDPLHPERVGYYPTSREPAGRSYKGAWGVYPLPEANLILVSDMQEGLFVLKGMGDVCSREETSPIACGAVTGIGQPPSIEWHIYPQPAFDHLLVEIPETVQQQAFQLILYNALGQKVTDFKAAPSETQLVLPLENNLLPGIYRLDIRTGSQILERKMILIGR